jgi:hypothetical protein
MAGIVVPTLFLLLAASIDVYHEYYFEVSNQFVIPLASRPLERALLLPMAVVPSAWGLWNMLYLRIREQVSWSLGLHGALLVIVLIPGGIGLAGCLSRSRSSGNSRCRWSRSAWPCTTWRGNTWSDS